jgi:23S rRNA (guanosine2251-2'-O)-methyltransferase
VSPAKRPKRAESPAPGKAARAASRRGATTRSGSGREKPPAPPKRGRGAPSGGSGGGRGRGRDAGAGSGGRDGGDAGRGGSGRYEGSVHPARRAKADRGLGGDQVEGRQAVRELLLGGRRVREVMVATDQDEADVLDDIAELAMDVGVPVREVSRKRLLAVARTESPQGVVALCAPLDEADLDDLARPGKGGALPFLVAVDGVTDPGNLGALLRSAECAGATGVVLPRHRAVHVTPTVTKAAAGAVEHLPMAVVGGLPAALARLRSLGVWVVGLDAGGERTIFEVGAVADAPVCLVLGAEGKGLSRLVRQRCDEVASIPLLGQLASLNVAAAGVVACYEIARRRAAPAPEPSPEPG